MRSAPPSGLRRPDPSWMMPIEVEKPRSRARLLIVRASSGFLMPPPTTELMFTSNVGVVLEILQLLVEDAEALLRDFVGIDVVDADLQEIEPGAVERLDAFRHQKVAVRDQAGHHAAAADVADQLVEVRMQHRLAAAERDDRRAELGQLVDAPLHDVGRHRRRHLVVLVAVAAVDVAAADRDDLDEQRMRGVCQPRANSRTDRTLRLAVVKMPMNPQIIAFGRDTRCLDGDIVMSA